MTDDLNATLREVRDLLREQNALITEIRDMNRVSMQQLKESQMQNERLIDRTEKIQSKTDRTFSVGNVVLYGAAMVIVLTLFGFYTRPW